jgi:Tol biopolymer transport system component
MQVSNLHAAVWVLSLAIPVAAQSSKEPVIAFAISKTLTLAASSGQVTQEIHLKQPIYDFALSKDRKLLVTVATRTETGGDLSLLNLQTRTQVRLTNGHVYFKSKDMYKGETEVYDNPQFSPGGRSVAFAIHTDNPGDGNDAINDSGPIAVMDLQTRRVQVLKSTTDIDGQGLCFANTPMWSPDGQWILFNCEDGAFITDARGSSLRDLKLGTERDSNTAAVSWVGNGCVLYVQGSGASPDAFYKSEEALLFNLHTSRSEKAAGLGDFRESSVEGLTEASQSAFIRRTNSELSIDTDGMKWTFPESTWKLRRPPAAHVIGGWEARKIPQECK